MRNESGFAMLEVLIAMLVIMFGVLGMAGMQMMAINNTETARYQSLATMLAASMAAEMQANPAYWGSPANQITVTNATISGITGTASTDCSSAVCTAQQMAYYDLKKWGASMNAGLPSAVGLSAPSGTGTVASSGKIDCPTATPMVCKITMYWSENNIALNNDTVAGAAGVLASGKSTAHQYTTLVPILL